MKTISVVADVEEGPYSAMWELLTAAEEGSVIRYFTESAGWRAAPLADEINAALFADIDIDGELTTRWVAEDKTVVDVGADCIEKLLGRGPDSLS